MKLVAKILIQNGKMSLEISDGDKIVHNYDCDAPAELWVNDVLLDLASFGGKKDWREKLQEFRAKSGKFGKKVLALFDDFEKTAHKDDL